MSKFSKTCLILLGGVILYLASYGPVAYAHVRLGWFHESLLVALYSPLSAIGTLEPVSTTLNSYVELWLGPGDCGTGKGG